MASTLDKQASEMVGELRKNFETGFTQSYKWRIEQARGILTMMKTHYKEWIEAGAKDFGKPEVETDICEVAIIEHEVKAILSSLAGWMAPESVSTPAWLAPASSEVRHEPYGVVLVIAPFNYPLQLALMPVLNALVAGNVVVLKPSELTPHMSALMAKLLPAYLDRRAIRIMEGAIAETTALLNQRWDLIFFTGSETVGRIVHQAAAKHLTPCILELGGKSPVYIDEHIRDLPLAARRLMWGKTMNAGQTCIAPDYLLVHTKTLQPFLEECKKQLRTMFGDDPKASPDLARIVSERHAERLKALLDDKPGKVEVGGQVDVKSRYVAPTLISGVKHDSKIMAQEIFGPLLPVLEVSNVDEAITIMKQRPNPLALYVFSAKRSVCDYVLSSVPSGSACTNDVLLQFCATSIPFGGVGTSGLGNYHGKFSFHAFTHARGVLRRHDLWISDIPLRYPPYSAGAHRLFRNIIDTLNGISVPSTFGGLFRASLTGLIFALGLYQLATLLAAHVRI